MVDKLQIEITIPNGFLHQGKLYTQGDVVTEDIAIATYFINAGWAMQANNTILNVDNVTVVTGVI